MNSVEALPPDFSSEHHPTTDNSFPIIAIAVIGILATAFLLVSYYVFVIKCCLNWHRFDIIRRLSSTHRPHGHDHDHDHQSSSSPYASRGLDESAIRTIPIFSYKKSGPDSARSFRECAVCLSEFQDAEKLRFIPNCNHAFHIDCIDVWLQSNANCPLCRNSITATPPAPLSPLFGNPTLYLENFPGNDEDYVIIDLPGRHSVSANQSLLNPEAERSTSSTLSSQAQPKVTELPKLASRGDECIDVRTKFHAQPIRRSFSLGSSDDQQLYLMVQEIIKQQSNAVIISPTSSEGCSSNSKLRRSFFSFGGSRGSKTSVLPLHSISNS